MTFDLTYAPTNASVCVGVLTLRNIFRSCSVSNGKLLTTITINENGIL